MPSHREQKPPGRAAAKRKGAAVAKADGAMQPVGKRRPKAKPKTEVVPARRLAGVGNAKATVVDASMVSLKSLSVGNGGAVIKVTETQAAAIRALGDSL